MINNVKYNKNETISSEVIPEIESWYEVYEPLVHFTRFL